VARFVADQRTLYRVPVAFTCALLGLSVSWFYKWREREPTKTQRRRAALDVAVVTVFAAARGLHGSPRLVADLREAGWTVTEKTVADSMRRQGLVARIIKRRNGLTKQDKTKTPFPDLVRRDFNATAANTRWVGDITEIPTAAGKLYLATVIDLFSRRLLGAATSHHPDAALAGAAIEMATAVLGGRQAITGVVFHTDRGSTGGFNWSSQHLDHGGVWWRVRGSLGRSERRARGGSGPPIGRCGRRCGRRAVRSRRGLCSVTSGV
jgi:putative transposase